MKNKSILFQILILFLANSFCKSESVSSDIRFLAQTIDTLGDKIKKDLDDNFRKLSAQLEANGRQVSKTLSIFEREWKSKTTRLSALEEKQDEVQASIMKLSQIVHQLQSFHVQFELKLQNILEAQSTSTTTTETPRARPNPMMYKTISSDRESEEIGSRPEQNRIPIIQSSEEILDWEEESPDFNAISNVIYAETEPTEVVPIQIQHDAATFYLSGTPESFRTLEPIPLSEQPSLVSVELYYVRILPEVLSSSLKNCTNLRSLKLIQVKLEGDWFNRSWTAGEENQIVLPALEDFVLDQVGVLSLRNDTIFSKWAEIDELLKAVDKTYLKRLIFFDKVTSQGEPALDIERVTSLGTNIDLRIDGIRIFRLNVEEGEMNSMLKFTNEFLNYLDPNFILRKVAISAWRLDIDLLPDSITHLNMNYVLDPSDGHRFNRKLQELHSLQDLNIFIGNQRDFGWSLTAIPLLQLKNLTIRYSDVRDFPKNSLLRLDFLYFHLCQFDIEFVQNFPKVFESVHVGVTFRKDSSGSGLQGALLRSILMTPVQWIFVQNFDRKMTKSDSPERLNGLTRLEQFLERTGIPHGVSHFVLQKIRGTWRGRALDAAELAKLTLQLMGTDKFVMLETYQKIFQS